MIRGVPGHPAPGARPRPAATAGSKAPAAGRLVLDVLAGTARRGGRAAALRRDHRRCRARRSSDGDELVRADLGAAARDRGRRSPSCATAAAATAKARLTERPPGDAELGARSPTPEHASARTGRRPRPGGRRAAPPKRRRELAGRPHGRRGARDRRGLAPGADAARARRRDRRGQPPAHPGRSRPTEGRSAAFDGDSVAWLLV